MNPIEYSEMNYPEMTTEYKKICEEQYELMCRKNMDYGPGNIALGTQLKSEQEKAASILGVMIRANDKVQRLLNLLLFSSHKPKNEPVQDSFQDLVNYGIIAQLVQRGKWGK